MSETKPPVDPGANPNDPNSRKPGWPFLSLPWYVRRVHAAQTTFTPASNPGSDALTSGKAPVDAPVGLEAAFAKTKALLAAIIVIGRGVGMSVLEAMGATSKTEGRMRRALQRGVKPEQIDAAFTAVNQARAFEDAHYDGGDVWFGLTYPRTIEAAERADERALITGDAEEALARLDLGIDYTGTPLAPGAVAAAEAAFPASGYADRGTWLLASVTDIRAGGGYDDILKDLTPQGLLDREMQARGGSRGPSGGDR